MTKDYTLRTIYVDAAQPTILHVCAADLSDAHSEAWQKLPENRHKKVDAFQIVTISACQHKTVV